jgi:hypothetical protein
VCTNSGYEKKFTDDQGNGFTNAMVDKKGT